MNIDRKFPGVVRLRVAAVICFLRSGRADAKGQWSRGQHLRHRGQKLLDAYAAEVRREAGRYAEIQRAAIARGPSLSVSLKNGVPMVEVSHG